MNPADCATEELAGLTFRQIRTQLARAFEGYCKPLRITEESLDWMLVGQGASLLASRRLLVGGEPAGIALVGIRGRTSRIAGFGVFPEFRGRGIGRWFLERLVQEARDRGESRIWLEVLLENEPAVRLYESAGFRRHRTLAGWIAREFEGVFGRAQEIDLEEAARRIVRVSVPDLPWLISGEAMCHVGGDHEALALGNAVAILRPTESVVQIRGLTVSAAPTLLQQLAEILRHAASRWKGRAWYAAPFFPEELLGATMTQLGFARDLVQGQYVLDLEAGP
ncbi:MAG: GNAT family N-acetyltransferase [Fimbriimonadales bacterium]|nr:GNAT family N-acetyltransferase [Fimbriimonadales bacterium]